MASWLAIFLTFAALIFGASAVTRRTIISTPNAPKAIGPYSQAVAVNDTLYVSGQIGLDPRSGKIVPGGVVNQTRRAMDNIGAILQAAGSNFHNVVKASVLLHSIGDYEAVNNVYKMYFTSDFPARAAFQPVALPKFGLLYEQCQTLFRSKMGDPKYEALYQNYFNYFIRGFGGVGGYRKQNFYASGSYGITHK